MTDPIIRLYKGKPLDDCTRAELLEVIDALASQVQLFMASQRVTAAIHEFCEQGRRLDS